jgi:ribonuclease HII
VASALCFNPENLPDKVLLNTINDSKKLTEKKREEIFTQLIELSR